MGGSKSKLEAEKRINATLAASQERERNAHKEHLARLERQQVEADEAKRRQDEIYRNERREAEQREREKEEKIREELRLIREQNEADKRREEQLSMEERKRMTEQFDATVRAKEEALRRQQKESRDEMERLRKLQESRDDAHAENLKKINDERLKQEEIHGQQLAAMAEKATAITREIGEQMRLNQEKAFEWLIAQEQAHLSGMSQAYLIMAAMPRAISSDKESQDLVALTSSIRNSVASIRPPFNKLDELFWNAGTTESYEQRQKHAGEMFEINEGINENFLKLVNSLEQSQNVDNNIREAVMAAILIVRKRAQDLSKKLRNLRQIMARTPDSIGDAEIQEIGTILDSLESACDEIPRLQGISATEILEQRMRQLELNDRESMKAINYREWAPALQNGDNVEVSTPTPP